MTKEKLTGQISRNDALEEIKKPTYSECEIIENKKYVIKKFNLTEEEFEKIMNKPIKLHTDFNSYANLHYKYEISILKWLKPISRPIKKIFGITTTTNYV